MTSQQYLDQFMNQTNVIDHCGGTIRDQVSTQNIIIHICVSTTKDDEIEVTMENDEQETNKSCLVTDLIGIGIRIDTEKQYRSWRIVI